MHPVRCPPPQLDDGRVTQFGRYAPFELVFAVSTAIVTLNGRPLWNALIPAIVQPAASARTNEQSLLKCGKKAVRKHNSQRSGCECPNWHCRNPGANRKDSSFVRCYWSL